MTRPSELIDAVIACHDPRRPLARCVASVLAQRADVRALGADVLVTVVVHNRDPHEIAARLTEAQRSEITAGGIRLLHLEDGIFSPAGPITLGVRESPGTWVTTVGSDDTLEPGSLGAWLQRARATRADAVLAPIRLPSGQLVRTPFLRPRPRPVLDPLADHLAYRTAPLGLLRTPTLRRIGFAYTQARLANGSDIEPGLRLWFRGGRITYPTGAPAYAVSGEMGAGRVTSTLGPAARELGWLPPLLAQEWLRNASRAEREEIATKVVRAHLVPVVRRRAEIAAATGAGAALWTPQDAETMAAMRAGLVELVGAPLRGLSIAERTIVDDASRARDAAELAAAWRAHEGGSGLRRALTPRLRDALRPTARLRLFAEQQVTQRRGLFGRDRDPQDGSRSPA